jgi:hypothetical protein
MKLKIFLITIVLCVTGNDDDIEKVESRSVVSGNSLSASFVV